MTTLGEHTGSGESLGEKAFILLVEDLDEDVFFILRALKQAGIKNEVLIAHSGDEAIRYLKGEGQFADRTKSPLPDLILLDLKMPGTDGFGVLRWLRSQEQLKHIIVVVLTGSTQIRDVNEAYKLGANSFLVKPDDFKNSTGLADVLKQYWQFGSQSPLNIPRPQADSGSQGI